MSLYDQQLLNEELFDKSHTVETMRDSLEKDFQQYVDAYTGIIKQYYSQTDFSYTLKDGTKKNWDSKQSRFEDMQELDIEKLAWDCIVFCLCKKLTTFTEVLGKFYKKFKHETDRMNLESASEFIALLNQTPFIDVIYPRDAEEGVLMIQSNVTLEKSLQDYLENQRFTLPSLIQPTPVETNSDTGYTTIKGSIILSGRHHEHEVCLDHINRCNSVALSIEERLIGNVEPVFKHKEEETELENQRRLENFNQCNRESAGIYAHLLAMGNKFYLTHRYCSRGRTYAYGYHMNSQGDNWRKAVLTLANKELVQM